MDVKIIDGAALVNMLPPRNCKTFMDYATSVFEPYVLGQAERVHRLDVVWDRYTPSSLKQSTREARGHGPRRRVTPNTTIPANWQSFLRNDDNKKELFAFLAKQVESMKTQEGTVLISTYNEDVLSSSYVDKVGIAPCNHEEADTRVILHSAHAGQRGFSKIMIRTVDTDVVVLAIANATQINVDELWIAFGVGKHYRYIPIHVSANELGQRFCSALPSFHALTGCDTVSALAGIGKKTGYNTWKCYTEVTSALCNLSAQPENILEDDSALIERFVILMYSRTSPLTLVNQARQIFFAQGNRIIENIPPTQSALQQHMKRAAYQAGHVWGQSLVAIQEFPSPEDWGWQTANDEWTPTWSTLPEASKSCQELIRCACKEACRGLCKCHKASLPCTALCSCAGTCYQE